MDQESVFTLYLIIFLLFCSCFDFSLLLFCSCFQIFPVLFSRYLQGQHGEEHDNAQYTGAKITVVLGSLLLFVGEQQGETDIVGAAFIALFVLAHLLTIKHVI